ncbi:MAG: hypothetical protein GY797_36600 [Deltaproteobacteria bacterium]|nr:hypothetical protein [Deltaproteobacteria bacterium]
MKSFWEAGEAILPETQKTFTDVWDVENNRLLHTFSGYIIGVSEDSKTFLMQRAENDFVLRDVNTGKELRLDKSLAESFNYYQRSIVFFRNYKPFVKDVFGVLPPKQISKPDSLNNIVLGPYLFMAMEFDFGDGIDGAYGQAIDFLKDEVVYTFNVSRHSVQVPINFSTVHNILFVDKGFRPYDLTTGEDVDNQAIRAIRKTLDKVNKQIHGITFHPDGNRMAVSLSVNEVEIWDINTEEKVSTLLAKRKTVYFNPSTEIQEN